VVFETTKNLFCNHCFGIDNQKHSPKISVFTQGMFGEPQLVSFFYVCRPLIFDADNQCVFLAFSFASRSLGREGNLNRSFFFLRFSTQMHSVVGPF
jgi:hypothetical protein